MKFVLGNDLETHNVNIGDELILSLGYEEIEDLDNYKIIFINGGWLNIFLDEEMFKIEDQFYEFDLDDFRNSKELKVTSEYISKNRCVIKIYFKKSGEYIPFMKINVTHVEDGEDYTGPFFSFLSIEYKYPCDCCDEGKILLDIGFNF